MVSEIAEKIRKVLTYQNGLLLLLLINILLLSTAIFSWNYYDVRYFLEWADVVRDHGILFVYKYARKVAYPPIAVLTFVLPHLLATSITTSLPIIRLIDKLPLIIAFNLIFIFLRNKHGLKTAYYWLANAVPYLVILVYQFDLLPALFILLAAYELAKPSRNPVKVAVYLALAILYKQILIFLALIPLIIYYKEKRFTDLKKYVVTGIAVASIVILPFFVVDPYAFIYKVLIYHSQRYPQELSLWAIPLYLYNYDYTRLPSWITVTWLPIYVVALVFYFVKIIKIDRFDESIIYKYFVIYILMTLIVNKVNNLGYLTWALPLLAIIINSKNSMLDGSRFLYIAISWIEGILYPFVTLFAAAVVYGSVLIIEDLSYYSALWAIERSIDRTTFVFSFIDYMRVYFYNFFEALYRGMGISATIFTLLYNWYLAYTLYKIYKYYP
ncbi:hypothetical protein Smar_0510 [Staphylothermus marinus F1]|uniref:DUF2029 domain-containing protein n=1 Tax=Staphylothermus marinus (strain ATCC 43588 / DSM 3639 / JCM 9404 / F1) TaxID=399550 RepID=A3DLV8_STAMF|nr:hypothetical protein Smar_0510 [Staphylothermus marinus F1]